MAVGIACAGTGLKEAAELLQNLLSDPTDYVRQVCYYRGSHMMVLQSYSCSLRNYLFHYTLLLASSAWAQQ